MQKNQISTKNIKFSQLNTEKITNKSTSVSILVEVVLLPKIQEETIIVTKKNWKGKGYCQLHKLVTIAFYTQFTVGYNYHTQTVHEFGNQLESSNQV